MSYSGLSFGQMVDRGMSQEQIMEICCMSEHEYEKVLACLYRIRTGEGI
jgi:hypothetical protein